MVIAPRYLLDTSIVIDAIRRRPGPLLQKLSAEKSRLATSTVVVYELYYGAHRHRDPRRARAQVDDFIQLVGVLELDIAAAEHAADIRARLAGRGTPIGPYDLLIAGQARARGLVVVTANAGEFERVEGLRVEDWTR